MNFSIKQYNGSNTGLFYIQCKGNHSGRPLENPIPNCFSVQTSDELLKEKVYALYIAGLFYPIIGGSVVPFIRISETAGLLNERLPKFRAEHFPNLKKVRMIDQVLTNLSEKQRLLKQLQRAIVFEILK